MNKPAILAGLQVVGFFTLTCLGAILVYWACQGLLTLWNLLYRDMARDYRERVKKVDMLEDRLDALRLSVEILQLKEIKRTKEEDGQLQRSPAALTERL